MGWSDLGSAGSNNDKTAGTSIVMTVSGVDPAPGEVVVVVVAKDNAGTTDTNTNEVTGVVDDAGNTWTKLREFCNGNGSAGAGAVIAMFYSLVTNQITDGDIIEASFSGSTTASAIIARRFSFGAGSTVSHVASADLADDLTDPSSLGISGLSSAEYLFIRAIATERDTVSDLTPTASHTSFGRAMTSGGVASTNMGVGAEFIIATATGDTSDPSLAAANHASTMVALQEVVAAATFPPNSLMMMSCGV